jgi:hypothetical protein
MATPNGNSNITRTCGVGEGPVLIDSTITVLTETNAKNTTNDTTNTNVRFLNDTQTPLHKSPLTSQDRILMRFDWMRACEKRLRNSFIKAFGMNAGPALYDQKLRAEALVRSMNNCWTRTKEVKPLIILDGVGRFLWVFLRELDKLPAQHPLRDVEINIVERCYDYHLMQLNTFPDDIYCTHGNFWDYAISNDNWVYGNFMGTEDKLITRKMMFNILKRRDWDIVTMISFSFRGENKPISYDGILTSNGLRIHLKHSKDADLRPIFKIVSKRKTFITFIRVHNEPSTIQ